MLRNTHTEDTAAISQSDRLRERHRGNPHGLKFFGQLASLQTCCVLTQLLTSSLYGQALSCLSFFSSLTCCHWSIVLGCSLLFRCPTACRPDLRSRCMTCIANSSFCVSRGTSIRRALVVIGKRQGDSRPLVVDRRQTKPSRDICAQNKCQSWQRRVVVRRTCFRGQV